MYVYTNTLFTFMGTVKDVSSSKTTTHSRVVSGMMGGGGGGSEQQCLCRLFDQY